MRTLTSDRIPESSPEPMATEPRPAPSPGHVDVGARAASRARGLRRLSRTLVAILTVVLGILAARSSLADHYTIPSGSMLPTIKIGDRVAVNKLAYGLRVPFTDWVVVGGSGPASGDVIILESPEDGTVLIKRVVAVPGDFVAVRDGQVFLNGRFAAIEREAEGLVEALGSARHPVDLDYGGGPDFGPVEIPQGQYLVLGDNRGESRDGRIFGLVPRRAVLGKAMAVYYRDSADWPSLVWKEL